MTAKREIDDDELAKMLDPVDRVFPRISLNARHALGADAELIERLGIPRVHADWFRAVNEIVLSEIAPDEGYAIRDNCYVIERAPIIGTWPFAEIVVDSGTGRIVNVDRDSGAAFFINTSLKSFLYFIARFELECYDGFENAVRMRDDFIAVDADAMESMERVWAYTAEEAIQDMY